jgi:hypothetical protein
LFYNARSFYKSKRTPVIIGLFQLKNNEMTVKKVHMDRSYIAENNRERERLRHLADSLTDEELALVVYQEGWTIAAALAHLAFWDQRRLILVRKWKQKGVSPSPMDEDTVNDALVPFFLEIPPRKAANLAISTARELDHELEESSPDFIAEMESTGDRHALNRAIHRKMHLDDIESLLQEKRKIQ